ncbi:MAG: cyanoexosortase A [Microcoleaceae cyanobacterium]
MTATNVPSIRALKTSKFWLLGIAAGLMAVNLTLTLHHASLNLQALSLLFWFAVAALIWQKRDRLDLDSDFFASLLGVALIAAVLLKGSFSPTSNFLGVSPFISGLGMALLASGFIGLRQYWRELTLLFFLGVPFVVLRPVLDISGLTAQLSTFILWYSGFEVSRRGFEVLLPNGGVSVNMGCSGFEGIFHLLGLGALFLIFFPLRGWKTKVLVPIVAVITAFIVNGFRVAFMAFFANAKNPESLEYWHVGDGSLMFSLISVGIFGLFCWFLLRQSDIEEDSDDVAAEV